MNLRIAATAATVAGLALIAPAVAAPAQASTHKPRSATHHHRAINKIEAPEAQEPEALTTTSTNKALDISDIELGIIR